MTPVRRLPLAIVLLAVWSSLAPRPGAAALLWPDTELARHARAWFAILSGDDASARRFISEHMAPSALAEASVDERMHRRAGTIARTQGLTPLEVVESEPAALAVRAHAGNGDDVVVTFDAEGESPHRLLGVRIEAGAGGPGGERAVRPQGARLDDVDAANQIRSRLDEQAQAGAFSGVALLARSDTVLFSGAWGLADRERKTPIAQDTRFNLASIGKIFTRTAIAQLAETGKLSLDDKLSRFLPDFPHADSITIDMLCRHRSGVGDFFNDAYRAMDRSKLRHNRDYLALIRDQPLWFAPGTRERYSNGGYALLGEVVARASGEDYYDYLAKHVFAPAGMTATSFPIEGDGTPGLAHGYTRLEAGGDGMAGGHGAAPVGGAEQDNAGSRPARGSAAGGGYSTGADLLAFDRALVSARLCGPAWAEWVTGGPRPRPADAEPKAQEAPPPEPPSFGFGGGAPGISTEWLHEGDVTLIVLTNRDPETTQAVLEPVRGLVRRMKPPAKHVRI